MFRERWPELRLRNGDSFSLAREKMTNLEVFKNYFELLRETLLEYNLMDRPSQIYYFCKRCQKDSANDIRKRNADNYTWLL